MKKTILTGDRPTGRLHLGHYAGSLKNRLTLQDTCDQYVMIADLQAMSDNASYSSDVAPNIFQVMMDYIAVGIDPAKTTIFLQSAIHELTELTFYYMNLVTVSRLSRNPTVKAEIQQKNYGQSVPAGFLCYPVSQAADITAFGADIVPVGADQKPMIEQTNEIVRKFNATYNTDCLKEVECYLATSSRLSGIDGKAKASKSLGNAIFLSDSLQDVRQKIFSMYTDPDHIKVSDPGKVEGNVVFEYLDAFHSDKEEIQDLKDRYRAGGLGDVTLKKLLNETLHNFLEPIRQRRAEIKINDLRDILHQGTKKASQAANHTMQKVRSAMGIKDILNKNY